MWGVLGAIALWWPAHISSVLDGAPLDRPLEAILLGLVFPALWSAHPGFLRARTARAAIGLLLLVKAASSLSTPVGWCVRFDPPTPIVRESTGRPHSWDVRADWTSPDPECSALMTHSYEDFKQFPIWFYNLPPLDDGWPSANDRPPNVALPMSVVGFLDTPSNGVFDVVHGPGMDLEIAVDGKRAADVDPLRRRIALDAGVHFVQISGTLTGSRWRLSPMWNGTPLGAMRFPAATVTEPSAFASLPRSVLGWAALAIAAALIASWIVSALVQWGHFPAILWAGAAAAVLAIIGVRESGNLVSSPIARWSITALALACLVPIPERLRTTRGAFLLVGVPWLTFIAAGFVQQVGRFSFYTGGEDSWTIQRYGYSIFLQGEWLRGGSDTFYFQPLYRWTGGALHMLFGDSSVGEFYADAACLLAAALFAYAVVRAVVGHRWGILAAVVALTIVMQGPTFGFLGRGLTDISSMGLLYMSALIALHRRRDGSIASEAAAASAVTATLAFYTRLANFPVAASVASMAVPLSVPVRALRTPAQLVRQTSWSLVAWFVGVLGFALLAFAARTWFYTGVFSITHGTSFGINRAWQPDLPLSVGFQRMVESLMVLLTLNDPPKLSPYSVPLLVATVATIAGVAGVKRLRELPLAVVLFFGGCCSIGLVIRGIAYSGRYSTHIIGVACALTVLAVAMAIGVRRLQPAEESAVVTEPTRPAPPQAAES